LGLQPRAAHRAGRHARAGARAGRRAGGGRHRPAAAPVQPAVRGDGALRGAGDRSTTGRGGRGGVMSAPADKQAVTRYPVDPLIRERWSPRAFADRPVDRETLGSLLEAARWAASCNNEQPWIFIVARKEDGPAFERILRCLVPGNQAWAQSA